MYNHLTATPLTQEQIQQQHQHIQQQQQHHHQQQQQQAQQQQHDIYSILSTDMPDDAPIDTAELVKDIFDSSDFTTTTTNTNNNINSNDTNNNNTTMNSNKPSPLACSTPSVTQSIVPTSTEFSFSHDFMNFDMNQQYTPSSQIFNDPFLSTLNNHNNNNHNNTTSTITTAHTSYRDTEQQQQTPSFNRQPDFNRRHSVAVSGGIADLKNRFQPIPTYGVTTSRLPMTRKAQTLPTVMESQQPHVMSNPISRFNNNNLDPGSSFQHLHRASMPNIFQTQDHQQQAGTHLNNTNLSSSSRTTPNSTPPPVHIQFNSLPWSQDEPSTSSSTMNNTFQQQQQGPPPVVFQRRRFYSQCGLPTPPLHTPQVQGLCPLPMSGVATRRASVATSNDIYTWNRNCENYKQQQVEKEEEEPVLKRPRKSSELKDDTPSSDYPVITDADLEAAKKDANAIPRRQKLRFDSDEYTPKWVRYTGQLKEGYCDTCQPGKWLQLKNSAYWYHKQFFHGISSVSGKPFEKPLEQRAGDQDVIEGLCHQCHTFVPICNSKRKNSVLWYRHAHKCHIYDKPKSKGGKRASISTRKYSETPQSIF